MPLRWKWPASSGTRTLPWQKALAEKRVQRARDGRKADELKRSIRNNAAQLNQMILRPSKGKYVQPRLIQQAAEVAKLADMAVLNDAAVRKLTALANTISQTQGTASDPSSLAYDWEQTGVPKLIQALQADMMNAKQARLDRLQQQLTEAEALGDGEKGREAAGPAEGPYQGDGEPHLSAYDGGSSCGC